MEKCVYYNELIKIGDINPDELYLNYYANEDSLDLIINNTMDLGSLEQIAKDILKFVNSIKKDQIKNK